MTSMFQYNDQIPDFISCGYLITTYGVALILVVTYAEYLFFLDRALMNYELMLMFCGEKYPKFLSPLITEASSATRTCTFMFRSHCHSGHSNLITREHDEIVFFMTGFWL